MNHPNELTNVATQTLEKMKNLQTKISSQTLKPNNKKRGRKRSEKISVETELLPNRYLKKKYSQP